MTHNVHLPRMGCAARWLGTVALLLLCTPIHAQAQSQANESTITNESDVHLAESQSGNGNAAAPTSETPKIKRTRDEDTLANHQASHAQLLEHFLGSTSKAIRFDWRHSPVLLGAYASEVVERNNFASYRSGILVRKAMGDVMLEMNFSGVTTLPTISSGLLSLTPYQQSGRPSRFEFEINGGYPIAEGVMTPKWTWLPPAQLVWMAYGGARYALYPTLLGEHWQKLFLPSISDEERIDLAPMTLPGMHVDSARFQIMVGTSLDVYFVPGIFITPRAMMAIPIGIDLLTGSDLGYWWEWGMAFGYAF